MRKAYGRQLKNGTIRFQSIDSQGNKQSDPRSFIALVVRDMATQSKEGMRSSLCDHLP